MITRVGFLQQSDLLSNEAFREHWCGTHSEIASQIPGILKYYQNHIIRVIKPAVKAPAVDPIIHGISQIWFLNGDAMEKGFSSPIIKALHEDEEKFIGKLNVVSVKQYDITPLSTTKSLVKAMIVIKAARTEADKTNFSEKVAKHLKSLPGVKGCYYYHVEDDNVRRQDPKLQIDLIVELWFKEEKGIEEAFSSEQYSKILASIGTSIEQISIFSVEEHIIVN